MNTVTVKRSPIVLIRTFIAIEVAGFICYSLAVALGNYKYELYTHLSLSSILSYQTAKFLLLSGAQLAITIYAFLRWHYENYIISPGMISHERGVFFRKKKDVPLQKTMPVTLASGPIGKLLRYGSIHIHNASAYNSLTLADISHPDRCLKIITKFMDVSPGPASERPDLSKLLSEEEHERLEFKSSLRFDHQSREINKELEKAAMKTIAAFLNSKGGRLVIGVSDTREPVGLERDYKTLNRQTSDGFENHFTQVFNAMVGPEFRHLVRLWFHLLHGRDVCVVDVAPSARPIYLKLNDSEHFYVRTGNVTTPLKLSEVESYTRARWPRRTATTS